jgi:hypothetical protein
VNANLDLYAWACTDINTFVSYDDLWIYSSWNYNISASMSSSNSTNIWSDSITNNIWIPY